VDIQQSDRIYVRIFRAVEQVDDFRRICAYALAKAHQKGTTVTPIVEGINETTLAGNCAQNKVYNYLSIGNRWVAIVDLFASIVKLQPEEVTGLMALLKSASL
jgi:hypothetical protein